MQHLRRSPLSSLTTAAAACVLLIACSEGTVSAPQGGSIVLEASPAAIGLGGQSQITALVRDQNGNPVRGDVEVLFFTDLGSIDRAARTSSNGLATATLTAGDTPGTATVRAVAGPNEAQIGVPIGTQVGGITLQADPTDIPSDTGGESQLVAVVRDSDDNPVVGAPVTFSTPLGSLDSGGDTDTVNTDDGGEARNVVTVTPEQAGSWDQPTFTVTATTPGPDGDVLDDTVDITIETLAPNAQFTFERGPAGGNWVQFQSESTGEAPLEYQWDFGDGNGSTAESPLYEYESPGEYLVKLTVSNDHGDDIAQQTINVPVPES